MRCFLTGICALMLCWTFCGCSSDENNNVISTTVKCKVYQSPHPKGNILYYPERWNYAQSMLFEVNVDSLAKKQTELDKGIATLNSGRRVAAKLRSDIGLFKNVDYIPYTLVVYSTGHESNVLMKGLYSWREVRVSLKEPNAICNCVLVYNDSLKGGGYVPWCEK